MSVLDENSDLLNNDSVKRLVVRYILEPIISAIIFSKSVHFFFPSVLEFHIIEFRDWCIISEIVLMEVHLSLMNIRNFDLFLSFLCFWHPVEDFYSSWIHRRATSTGFESNGVD